MLLASFAIVLAACAPAGQPLVAEVFYDAIGDDTGHEFVEIWNPNDRPVALGGAKLEAGDGAGPGRWTTRWTGGPADTIPAHGRFVVGGARVEPAPQAVAALDLQNGPDAMRLVWPDGAIEVVGWGALAYAEYFCGAPAPDVASGLSLARVPDGADLGSNALDFHAASPSPGRANQPGRDAALVTGSLALDPGQPEPGRAARLALAVTNRGAVTLAPGDVRIAAEGSAPGAETARAALPGALAPGESTTVVLALVLPAGKQWLRARVSLEGDEDPADDADSIRVRAGPGPLAITEIQFHPAGAEGEWVEVLNRSGAALDPAAFTLSDRGTSRGQVAEGAGPLAPDSLAVMAQDRAALLALHPELDGARVWEVSPWAALNDRDDSTGVADVVALREEDGTPCDRVAYSAAGVPRGVPVERRADGGWGAGAIPGGSPLAPPRAPRTGPLRVRGEPRRVRPGATVELSWTLPWASGTVGIELYDLAGRRVATPMPPAAAAGSGSCRWKVADAPPGLYLLAMTARDPGGADARGATQPLRIEGRVP